MMLPWKWSSTFWQRSHGASLPTTTPCSYPLEEGGQGYSLREMLRGVPSAGNVGDETGDQMGTEHRRACTATTPGVREGGRGDFGGVGNPAGGFGWRTSRAVRRACAHGRPAGQPQRPNPPLRAVWACRRGVTGVGGGGWRTGVAELLPELAQAAQRNEVVRRNKLGHKPEESARQPAAAGGRGG